MKRLGRWIRSWGFVFEGMFAEIPIYVTRPSGPDKVRGHYSMPFWMAFLAQLLIWTNIVLWGILGAVKAGALLF